MGLGRAKGKDRGRCQGQGIQRSAALWATGTDHDLLRDQIMVPGAPSRMDLISVAKSREANPRKVGPHEQRSKGCLLNGFVMVLASGVFV
jgi:hypothetical protein